MRGILDRIVGQAEERRRQRHRRLRPIGHQPRIQPPQPVAPIVGRAVQRQHVQPRLDQRDEGQEMLAVEPVLIEILGGPVGGGDDRHPTLDQRGEQPRQDHRVRAVRHHHLVEGQQPHFLGQRGGNGGDRVARLLGALGSDAGVHLQHELGEMDAALGLDRDMVEEQVHQHRLAAPDIAPEIDALGGRRALAGQAGKQSGLARGFQFGRKLLEPGGGGGLFGIGAELFCGDQATIGVEDVGHVGGDVCPALSRVKSHPHPSHPLAAGGPLPSPIGRGREAL